MNQQLLRFFSSSCFSIKNVVNYRLCRYLYTGCGYLREVGDHPCNYEHLGLLLATSLIYYFHGGKFNSNVESDSGSELLLRSDCIGHVQKAVYELDNNNNKAPVKAHSDAFFHRPYVNIIMTRTLARNLQKAKKQSSINKYFYLALECGGASPKILICVSRPRRKSKRMSVHARPS